MAEKPDKEQKTEKPTPKRKKEARKQGQIAKSPDVAAWVIVLAATWLVPLTISRVWDTLRSFTVELPHMAHEPDARRAAELFGNTLAAALVAIAPLLVVLAALGLASMLAQVGFVFSGKALMPKGERLNPLAGLKRLFSASSLWETVKATLKLVVVAVIAVPAVWQTASVLLDGSVPSVSATLTQLGSATLSLVRNVAAAALVLAAADYGVQRRRTSKMLMMTKQELKQELKNSEGDPMVKGKIRALQRAASRNRMLAAVADANVVIMNPTHVAVALRYRPGAGAPRVVAKGRDKLALRIRDAAQDHEVPVVEAPPLARALHAACELDQEIPERLFTGVAKVLAFVHRLHGRTSMTGVWVLNDVPAA